MTSEKLSHIIIDHLEKHREEFRDLQQDWREHRLLVDDSIRKVTNMHEIIIGLNTHIKNLDELPTIAAAIRGLQHKMIRYVIYLVFGTMFILALIICVLLMRDSIKDFKVPGWVEITTPGHDR